MLQVNKLYFGVVSCYLVIFKISISSGRNDFSGHFPEAFLAFIKISQRRKNISAESGSASAGKTKLAY